MASIIDIEGIGPAYQEKLALAGIKTTEALLNEGATKKGRATIAATSGIDEGKILDWVNMADLFRIKGIASQFAELLKAAGVDTVKELRNRNAENLHARLNEVNLEKNLTRVVPSLDKVADFIEQAKQLEPLVTY
jgi:predicted flap endonuclease-1-like 5' DNA nuclease